MRGIHGSLLLGERGACSLDAGLGLGLPRLRIGRAGR